ncbi:MAG: clostripain-related cysteine peptidase [bacterium]
MNKFSLYSRIINKKTMTLFFVVVFSSSFGYAKEAAKPQTKLQPKDWNFIVYIAGNNDLHRFSIHNLKQMLKVGSTDSLNIIVQFDEYLKREVTRYYVEKEHLVVADSQSDSIAATSGTPESLYDFASWAIESYPAQNQALVLWNHGYGIKDPSIWGRTKMLERDKLFTINYQTGLLELNRKNFFEDEEMTKRFFRERGIAFNDTAQEYLTNQDLTNALEKISNNLLDGNKIDILFMDACHMGMLEIGSQIKDFVHYMVASEEVEPGTGYNYIYLLEPFLDGSLSAEDFAKQGVLGYEEEYNLENADYTQSAINLYNFEKVEINVKEMGTTLTELLADSDSNMFFMLRKIRSRSTYTTSFCDPEYIDFCHFYISLVEIVEQQLLSNSYSSEIAKKLKQVKALAEQGLNMMQNYIIKNASGINLPHAYGLAFYFPTKKVHSSYYKTNFDKITKWSTFLEKYIYMLRH